MMKDILIIFAVLLVLLTLVSALGGSVRYGPMERFDAKDGEGEGDEPMMTGPMPPHTMETMQEGEAEEEEEGGEAGEPEMAVEPFDGGSYASA